MLGIGLLAMVQLAIAVPAADRIQASTSVIEIVSPSESRKGTGFFYQQTDQTEVTTGHHWSAIQKMWLVTNRHVLLGDGGNDIPTTLTFALREEQFGQRSWLPITLDREELLKRSRCHGRPNVDICIVDVLDLVVEVAKLPGAVPFWGVTRWDLPNEKSPGVDIGDDVLVVGYPWAYYDNVNLTPVAKAGVVSTKWGVNFRGQPTFMIDAKLFPGSSGSLVVTKPRDIAIVDGRIMSSLEGKLYNFLGIFSGEPYQESITLDAFWWTIKKERDFNVGLVWYGWVIQEVVDSGVAIKP